MEKSFKIVIPADIRKSDDGEWLVEGIASTASRDRQGEVILQNGIDPTPIKEGRAYFNWDHAKGPENILGPIDTYRRDNGNFIVKGRLFKNHQKAQAVREIMSSLGKSDRGRMGMSVEGKIVERSEDGKTIKRCEINAVALTMNPVNTDSYADLVKSMDGANDVDFATATQEAPTAPTEEAKFTMTEVMEFVQKALSVGSGYAEKTPGQLSGGEALASEDLDSKKNKKKTQENKADRTKMKKMNSCTFEKSTNEILNKLQELYPSNTRDDIWSAVKDRLFTRFPETFTRNTDS